MVIGVSDNLLLKATIHVKRIAYTFYEYSVKCSLSELKLSKNTKYHLFIQYTYHNF